MSQFTCIAAGGGATRRHDGNTFLALVSLPRYEALVLLGTACLRRAPTGSYRLRRRGRRRKSVEDMGTEPVSRWNVGVWEVRRRIAIMPWVPLPSTTGRCLGW